MKKNLSNNTPDIKFLFSLILAVFIVFNSFHLSLGIKKLHLERQRAPFQFYGFKFSGLPQFLKGVVSLGYYTDKDMADKNHAAQYAQAQYALAPLILDLNYGEHDFILFDCSDEKTAMKKIKSLGLIPLKRNQFGILLAKRIR